ncbi:hypothetical protein [Snodgrassella sp. ESL0253]|uniref:hypothetical protein n=1 Tax=Snodgrassella sp. ESL0253 TaxID=2705031 RepID=UPI001581C820|nr:hypothetical protein [Snodgrassella sp. ESL0253]NUE67700.1 hypothetical protein [Snodgrassella sp. ESL0253]
MKHAIDKLIKIDFQNFDFLIKDYFIFSISIFDHILNEEEYINAYLVSYADIKSNIEKKILFNKIKRKFVFIYKILFKLSRGIVIAIIDEKPRKIVSFNHYMYIINNILKEKKLCTLIYPLLGCITTTGYDLTHQFLISKNKILLKREIEIIVKKVGLNIIRY